MSCPLNRNRWPGSGYVKDSAASVAARELNRRMEEMMAIREAQNNGDFSFKNSANAEAVATVNAKLVEVPTLPNMPTAK
jgi:hypothetical protein